MATSTFLNRWVLSALAAGALLAGCGGSQTPLGPTTATGQNAPLAMHVSPNVKGHCPAHGGVRVDPCALDFNASNVGPDTVTVRTPKAKKGTLSESDACGGPSGVASLAQGTDGQWTVTAGSTAGSCTAEFDFTNMHGKKIGYAMLAITNEL